LGEAFDFAVGFWRIFVGFDCSWTGLEWKIDESIRGWDFFPVGGLKLNSKIVAKCFSDYHSAGDLHGIV
jgi:hypothetical protein